MAKFMADIHELLDGIKAWVESKLSGKANVGDSYTKSQEDSLLSGKADSSALTTHTGNSDIHVTAANKSTWSGKYSKPSGGIPSTDMSSDVKTALSAATSAVQPADLEDASVAYADEAGYATSAGSASSASSVAWANVTGKPTLGTASAKDVPASGNATTSQVVMGNDTRLTDSRTPLSHTHAISDVTGLQTSLNSKYTKPSSGIPETDLTGSIQTKLSKGNSAVQPGDLATASVQNSTYATKIGTNSSHPAIGGTTQPVYIDSNGDVKACTAYSSASVNYATSAGSATTASTANAVDVDNLTDVTWMDADAVEEYLNG